VLPSRELIDLTRQQFSKEKPIFENPEYVSPEKLGKSVSKKYMDLSLKIALPDE
jgi:hypothetical protein